MRHRSFVTASISFCLLFWTTTAHAQIASPCLRPLGIPDKWIENQTPPWDPTDTFDPTGASPDLYPDGWGGFNPLEDQGQPMSLVVYNRIDPLQGQSAWPLAIGENAGLYEEIVACSGYVRAVGESFSTASGAVMAPFGAAMRDLIAQDPDAMWDPTANGGRGGVINSAFTQSPRIIALPVFAPNSYGSSTQTSPTMIKIVGFFVAERTLGAVHGFLTGRSQLDVPPVTARIGEVAQLSATLTSPGAPVAGVTIEFLHDGMLIAEAQTDGTGTARPETTTFPITNRQPGDYPGAIQVRLRESPDLFFVADEATTDLTVLKKLPMITWAPPAAITYGTPLGPEQLNATADIPGHFTYTPGAGTILTVDEHEPTQLSVTFVPAADESEYYDSTGATTYIWVVPAPLTLALNDATKLYLDPLPAFTFTATGFVNGENESVLVGTPTFETLATASSPVGTYRVSFGGLWAPNYAMTNTDGVLTIVPRPTVTTLQPSSTSAITYGEVVSFTVGVVSGAGSPAGTITLMSGNVPVAAAPLVNGQATLSVALLDAGNHALSAHYAGAGGFAASTSPVVMQTVIRASTSTPLTSSLNPSRTGEAVTFRAAVGVVAPGAGTPAGSVEFLRDNVVVATVPLANGVAQLTIDNLSPGKHAIHSRYVGSANYLPSASAVLQQAVKGGGK